MCSWFFKAPCAFTNAFLSTSHHPVTKIKICVTLFSEQRVLYDRFQEKYNPKFISPRRIRTPFLLYILFIATNFVILVSLLAIPCLKYPCLVKCHLAYLSYLSPYPSIKTKLHDGTTFMSSEFRKSIVHVTLHIIPLVFIHFQINLRLTYFNSKSFVILVCKCKLSSKWVVILKIHSNHSSMFANHHEFLIQKSYCF